MKLQALKLVINTFVALEKVIQWEKIVQKTILTHINLDKGQIFFLGSGPFGFPMHRLFILLFVVLPVCIGCSHSQNKLNKKYRLFEQQISRIPLSDQQKLETLFHHMLTGDYFACTLFGNKPMTFQEFHEDPWKMSSYCMTCPFHHYFMGEGWKTWMQYRSLFPSPKFIFTKIPSKAGYEFIILINKPAFREMFHENRDIFKQVLGTKVTAETLLQDFEEGKKTFDEVLNDHDGLVGFVLGYGRENSLQVYRSDALQAMILKNILYPLSPPLDEGKLPKNVKTVIKFHEKRALKKGIKWHQIKDYDIETPENPYTELNKDICFFRPQCHEWFHHILSPNFSCIKDALETEKIRKEYDQSMVIGIQVFKTTSFLRGFLWQYCVN